jgi:hypothetical protein
MPEASMAMKKTSGGDSPLWQGAEKSFSTLLILGRRWWRIAMCFWKSDRVFRFFSSGGLYRRRGSARSGPGGAHHRTAWPGPRPCPLVVRPPSGSVSSPLRCSRSFVKYLGVRLLFRPIPRIFSVKLFWNTKIAENRELALWHLVNRLVSENA